MAVVKRLGLVLLGLAVVLIAVLLALQLLPVAPVTVEGEPDARSAAEAADRITAWQRDEEQRRNVQPACTSRFPQDPVPSDRAVVLLHGFTNCPAQWDRLADQLAAEGWAVIVPLLPGHGLTSDESLSTVTADELITTVDRSVAIARGLADEVAVAGISQGGVLAAWVGTQRDVDLVFAIAPSFSFSAIPSWSAEAAARIARIMPNVWRWWDPEQGADLEGPSYAYARFPTRAFGQIARVGEATVQLPPATEPGTTIFLLNPDDPAVDNTMTEHLARDWAQRGFDVSTEYFPSAGLPHDVVDPFQPGADLDTTYPKIIDLLTTLEGSPTS